MAMQFPAKITSSCIWVAIPVEWVTFHLYACGADGRTFLLITQNHFFCGRKGESCLPFSWWNWDHWLLDVIQHCGTTLNNRFWTVLRFYLICFWLYGMSTTWWKNVKRLVISHHLSCTAQPRGLSYYWVSLHTRRMELCSKLFTKIKEPESRLRHLVPPTRSQAHGRSLRNKDRPSLISCKTEFKRSFLPAMCLYAHGM